MIPCYNIGLLWSHDHLLVISDKKIEEFDASAGSKVSEWPVPDTNGYSCIALPKYEQFTAYSSQHIVTFQDTLTYNQLPLTLQHPGDICSIAFSPDDQIFAIGGEGGKITIQSLSGINVSATSCHAVSFLNSFLASASNPFVSPTSHFPRTPTLDAILDLWKRDHLENAEASLSASINQSQNPKHHLLVS